MATVAGLLFCSADFTVVAIFSVFFAFAVVFLALFFTVTF